MQEDNHPRPIRIKIIASFGFALFIVGAIAYQDADALTIFISSFLSHFIETLPFLLLAVFTSGMIEVFVRAKDIQRWIPSNPLTQLLLGLCLGFLFPVGEWGLVPVTRRLFSKAVPISICITFLLAAALINPIALASSLIAFGFTAVFIGRIAVTVMIALIVALVMNNFAQVDEVLKPQSRRLLDNRHADAIPMPFRQGLSQAFQIAVREFFEMAWWLMLACAVIASVQTLLALDALISPDTNPITATLALQIHAFIISLSTTADSIVALAFVKSFATGSVISFLSFGAMLDIKTVFLLSSVFRPKIILYLLIMTFLMNLLAGVTINLVFG